MSAFKNQTSNRWKAVSTRFDDLDEDEQKKLKNEQWAVGFKLSLSLSLSLSHSDPLPPQLTIPH